jgi:hypothetical protein
VLYMAVLDAIAPRQSTSVRPCPPTSRRRGTARAGRAQQVTLRPSLPKAARRAASSVWTAVAGR